jgi:hypothetical protein
MKIIFELDNNNDDLEGGAILMKHLKSLLNQSYNNKNNDNKNIDNKYFLDEDLSTDKTKVYKTDNNEVVIANRGTSDYKDVISDIKLALGYKDKRFDEAKDILNKVKNKYKDSPIDVIGHSLGAKVAEEIGNDPQVKNVITLNKPTTPADLFKKSKSKDKQIDIRTSKDIVSALQPLQKDANDIIIPSETNNLYTEHKINVLDRLNEDLLLGKGINRLDNDDIKKLIKYVLKHKKLKNNYTKYDIDLLKILLK